MGKVIAAGNTLTVGANAESAELIASDKIRCPDSGTLVLMAMSTQVDTSCKLLVGGEAVVDDMVIPLWITPAVFAYPDHVIAQTRVRKGDALSLKFRAITASTPTYRLFLM